MVNWTVPNAHCSPIHGHKTMPPLEFNALVNSISYLAVESGKNSPRIPQRSFPYKHLGTYLYSYASAYRMG